MITVITPSLNKLDYLRRCRASVADQAGVDVEHIVVDGGSTDGTAEWLRAQPGIRWVSEPDQGMYDAINKGLNMAKGDLLAYLNADEQYLPDALESVARFFEQRPEADLVFGDALMIRPDGELLAYRKACPARPAFIAADHLYNLSCAIFFRRRVVEKGARFDATLRMAGDGDFVVRLLRSGARAAILRRYLAAFTVTGSNLGRGQMAAEEGTRFRARAPAWIRLARPLLKAARRIEKVLCGAWRQTFPLSYAVFTPDSGAGRKLITASRAGFRWPD